MQVIFPNIKRLKNINELDLVRLFRQIMLLSFILAISSLNANSQTYLIHKYTEEEGVPGTRVLSMEQDYLGRIWFSTRHGAGVYNGKNWQILKYTDIVHEYKHLTADDKKRIWGISLSVNVKVNLLSEKEQIQIPVYDEKGIAPYLSTESLLKVISQSNNYKAKIAIGFSNYGVLHFENGKWKRIVIGNELKANEITTLGSNFYIASQNGIYFINKNLEAEKLKINNLPEGEIVSISSCNEKQGNTLWVLGNNYIGFIRNNSFTKLLENKELHFDDRTRVIQMYPNYFNSIIIGNRSKILRIDKTNLSVIRIGIRNGLNDNSLNDILVDREKNLWLPNDRGISKVSSMRFSNYSSIQGLLEDEVTSIEELTQGTYIFGHNAGITVYNNDKGVIKKFDFSKNTVLSRILDLTKGPDGNIYISSFYNGFLKLDKNLILSRINIPGFTNRPAIAVEFDSHQNAYFVSDSTIYLKKYNESGFKKIYNQYGIEFRKLFITDKDEIFLTTISSGLSKYTNNNMIFCDDKNHNYVGTFTLESNYKGNFYVGTNNGLTVFKNNKLFESTYPQLIKKPVYSLKQHKGFLWIGTDRGVIKWNGIKTRTYSVKDGLAGLETNRDGTYADLEGNIWFGTNRGVSKYNPNYDLADTISPICSLDSIDVNNVSYSVEKPLNLKNEQNSLVFHFNVYSYSDEKRNLVYFKLDGYDDDWQILNTCEIGKAVYRNLAAGKYKFIFKAVNSLGRFSDPIYSKEITIALPFYFRIEFIFILVILILILIFVFYNYISNLQYKKRLEIEVSDRTSQLISSEKRYKQMFIDNNAYMLLIDAETGAIVDVNPSALDFYGIGLDDFQEITIFDLTAEKIDNKSEFLKLLISNRDVYSLQKTASNEIKNVYLHLSCSEIDNQTIVYAIIEDVSDRVNAERNLIRREQEFKALVEHSPDIVARFGLDLSLLYVNPCVEKYLSVTPEYLCEKPDRFYILLNEVSKNYKETLANVFKSKQSAMLEFVFKKGNSSFYFETYLVPEFDSDSRVNYVLAVHRDITERKSVEERILNINAELEDRVSQRTDELQKALGNLRQEILFRAKTEEELFNANERLFSALEKEKDLGDLKSRFISMISHEYRTPLTVILSSAYLIKESIKRGLENEVDRHLHKIQASVNVMSRLLEDVLTFGKSEAGKLAYKAAPIELISTLNEIIEEVNVIDQERHTIHFDNSIEINMISDRKLLRHILVNILINSTKFSPRNSNVFIVVNDNDDTISISVRDEGMGMSDKDIESLYEPFYRNEKNIGIIPGTGLGLSIAKRCLIILKGEIFVNNKLEKGTEFVVTFPKNNLN